MILTPEWILAVVFMIEFTLMGCVILYYLSSIWAVLSNA